MRIYLARALGVLSALVLLRAATAAQTAPDTKPAPPVPAEPKAANGVRQSAQADAAAQGYKVLDLQQVSAPGPTPNWVVLLGQPVQGHSPKTSLQTSNILLRLYAQREGRYRCVFSQGPLEDPRFGHDPATAVALECVDLNGDGIDEVIVPQTRPGASWIPGCAFVYGLGSNKLFHVATIASHYPIQISRLGDGNRPAIPSTYAIGKTLAHYLQPRWTDYYRYDGKQMILANSLCPERFRDWPRQLHQLLSEHGSDAELWYFLGKAYQALGNENEAVPAFEKARSLGYLEPEWKTLRAGVQPAANADSTPP